MTNTVSSLSKGKNMIPSAASDLSIHLLGIMTVRKGGQPVAGFRTQKSKWLLAYLVLQQGKAVEYEALGERLWPGTEIERAVSSVRQCVSDLNAVLGNEALYKRSRSEVGIDLTQVYVDVFAFDAAAMRRDPASLLTAVALYEGDLLEGCHETWALPARESRRQLYALALDLLIEQAQADGDYDAAERYLRRAVAAEGLKETKRCSLMRLLARRGEYNAAMEVYTQFRSLLHDPHMEPGREITRLWRELRERARSATSHNPTVPTPLYRMPLDLKALVGRQAAILEVVNLFTLRRLVTLTGSPGIGKTQMALHIAEHLRDDFPDGIVFLDLTDVKNEGHLWRSFLSTLQGTHTSRQSVEESVVAQLENRQMLLVLDSCEHLVDRCASVVKELLQTCSSLRILATSHKAWGTISGERIYIVPPLTIPGHAWSHHHGAVSCTDLADYTSVRLFLERAQEIVPGFDLTQENAKSIAQLCRQLDGIPLAITQAAGWLKTLSPQQIFTRLQEGLDLLHESRQIMPVRHRRLITTLEVSYQLLPPPLQSLFRQLAVFHDGWSLEAVEAISGSTRLLEGIRDLQERSLVEGGDGAADRRCRLLKTMQQYGALLLEQYGETAAFRRRHCDYFLRMAETAEAEFLGPHQEVTLAKIAVEFGNLAAAMEWTCETGETEMGLRIAGALWRYWYVRGICQEGVYWLGRLLSLEGATVSPSVRSKALNGAGNLAFQWHKYAQAQAFFRERLELEEAAGTERGQAGALGGLANVACAQGDYAEARTLFERALTSFQSLQDSRGIIMTMGNLAVVASKEGDFLRACVYHEKSAAFFRSQGDWYQLAVALNNLADIRIGLQEFVVASHLLAESLELSGRLGSVGNLAHSVTLTFFLLTQRGSLESAAALLGAHAAFRERNNTPLPEDVRTAHQDHIDRVRAGIDSESFERAYRSGALLNREEMAAFAITALNAIWI